MSRRSRAATLALAIAATVAPVTAKEPLLPNVSTLLARYAEAHGGRERWSEVRALELLGIHATFSEKHPFTLLRARPDRYRFDFTMLGNEATRARDGHGPWWIFPLLGVGEATRLDDGPYHAQIMREAWFDPPLLGAPDNGVTVTVQGYGEVDGLATLDVAVALPDGSQETWHLDPATFLEIAIDSEVNDHSHGPHRIEHRTFYSDFRTVEGLVLPHRIEVEFGARLEVTEIESVTVHETLPEDRFAGPEAEATSP